MLAGSGNRKDQTYWLQTKISLYGKVKNETIVLCEIEIYFYFNIKEQ